MSVAMKSILARVIAGDRLSEAVAQDAIELIMAGEATDAQIGALLTALRMRGETVDEVAGAVRAMRARVAPVRVAADVILDTCGTGGDGAGTFNISTAVAFVCAAAGVTVAKHGNRAISSQVGSADVLERLGVRIDLTPEAVVRCIEDLGVGFMFAPTHHAALRFAGAARAQLGFRTMLNLLGPMTSPAGATHQLIGIYDPTRRATVAEVLQRLGSRRAMVVHGETDAGGLDEISTSGDTHAAVLEGGETPTIRELTFTPEGLGVARVPVATIAGGDGAENARLVRGVLEGTLVGPHADIVRVNAGAALWVAEKTDTLAAGIELAGRVLQSGRGYERLVALAKRSRELAP